MPALAPLVEEDRQKSNLDWQARKPEADHTTERDLGVNPVASLCNERDSNQSHTDCGTKRPADKHIAPTYEGASDGDERHAARRGEGNPDGATVGNEDQRSVDNGGQKPTPRLGER